MTDSDINNYRLGVDVGGTFTDIVLIENATGKISLAKVPSTPENQSIGILNGINRVCELNEVDPELITEILHGTTVATNAVLTRKGARVGLVTSRGFRQVLHMGRSRTPSGVAGWVPWVKLEPLAPLDLTVEANERLDVQGNIIEPLDEDDIAQKLETLAEQDIEALTISLIHSYVNPVHERKIREIAQKIMPDVTISISSEVLPEMQEYERAETTVVNSYVRPEVSRYVHNLRNLLSEKCPNASLRILRSDGGLVTADGAAHSPVNLLMSGPAGGVAGSLWVAEQAGYSNVITLDMGGTSTDVALIRDNELHLRRETHVGEVSVRASSIDVRTVGAGGGSISYVPELTGALRVGPQSAGALPGPAAYGRGGVEPTVTDANVVLGYLPASLKLGGTMQVDVEAAEKAVGKVADTLGVSIKKAAEGIISIVTEHMLGALRLVSLEKGYDPREFALMAFGGAGPLHANELGRLIGAWPVIIPPGPGVLCAYGAATTRLREESSQTFVRQFHETSDEEVLGLFDSLAESASSALLQADCSTDQLTTVFQMDLRYHGQGNALTVELDPQEFHGSGLKEFARRYDELHYQQYSFSLDDPHEIVNIRAIITGADATVKLPKGDSVDGDLSRAKINDSTIHYQGEDMTATIYQRELLCAGDLVEGPAIVSEMDSTTVILPGHTAKVDDYGNLIINPTS